MTENVDEVKQNNQHVTDLDDGSDLIDPDAPPDTALSLDPDVQTAIVAATLVNEAFLLTVKENLSPRSFVVESHRLATKTILDHYAAYGKPPTKREVIETIRGGLDKDKWLAVLGEVSAALDFEPSLFSLEFLSEQVRMHAAKDHMTRSINKHVESWSKGTPTVVDLEKGIAEFRRLRDGKDNPYAADLRKRGIAFTHDATLKALAVDCCPCCGLPGVFSYAKDDLHYKCAVGKRSWVDGRGLWKAHRMDNGFFGIDDILDSDDPEWLIESHIAKRKVSLIFGPPEIAKSFMTLDRAMRVAYGLDYLGCATTMGKVVYLYSEGGDGLKRRIKAWLLHNGIDANDVRKANIKFHFKRYDLSSEQQTEKLAELIETQYGKIDLLVVDTLAKNFKAGENEDMQRLVDAGEDLREMLGAAIDIVHHTGKDTSRGPRGGSQLTAGVDQTWELVGIKSPTQENVYIGVKVIPRKLKDGRKLAPFVLEYKELHFSDRPNDHSIVLVPSDMAVPTEKPDRAEFRYRQLMHDTISVWRYVPGAGCERQSKAEIRERQKQAAQVINDAGGDEMVVTDSRVKLVWKFLEYANLISRDSDSLTRAKIRKCSDDYVDFFNTYSEADVAKALR